jgi:hypothetical protein
LNRNGTQGLVVCGAALIKPSINFHRSPAGNSLPTPVASDEHTAFETCDPTRFL